MNLELSEEIIQLVKYPLYFSMGMSKWDYLHFYIAWGSFHFVILSCEIHFETWNINYIKILFGIKIKGVLVEFHGTQMMHNLI